MVLCGAAYLYHEAQETSATPIVPKSRGRTVPARGDSQKFTISLSWRGELEHDWPVARTRGSPTNCRGRSQGCCAACLHRCFMPQSHEEITSTLAVRALFIAVISGCLAVCTFAPIRCFGTCVNATAALFAAGFGTTAVYDPHVVTGASTLCTTRNRQFSLHLLMIRLCWCIHLFQE